MVLYTFKSNTKFNTFFFFFPAGQKKSKRLMQMDQIETEICHEGNNY